MIGKLKKDESGMVMALAVIMIALFSVMGAGLLVFATTDLGIVVESNQGQRAFEMADAGVKAAKRQLESEMGAEKYNDNSPTGDDIQWAKSKGGMTLDDLDGDGDGRDTVHITIENAGANSFRVVSTGEYGPAKRRIEAYYQTRNFSIPMGYYTTNNRDDSIDIRSDARIHGMSVFAMGGAKVDTGHQFIGNDILYGNWAENGNLFNKTARSTTTPGIGAVCEIQDDTSNLGSRDFDGKQDLEDECFNKPEDIEPGTGNSYTGAEFVETPSSPQGNDQITFPFDRSQMTGTADTDRLAHLKSTAQANGTYVTETNPGGIINNASPWRITNWPANSNYDTVVYIELNPRFKGDGTLDKPKEIIWDISSSPSCNEANPKKGILVIQNGNLDIPSNKALFSGVTILRGARPNEHDDAFNGAGTASCWEGPVNTDGETTISGKFGFFTGINPNAVYSSLRGAELQSWREVYSAD